MNQKIRVHTIAGINLQICFPHLWGSSTWKMEKSTVSPQPNDLIHSTCQTGLADWYEIQSPESPHTASPDNMKGLHQSGSQEWGQVYLPRVENLETGYFT
ncbi:hypothetical protein HYFRA_00010364 [Hymenoscyphus fraxineus]|uniref:Uncharacterized protein n=1 Tax=Hymenoscyphus fraxineus TaxID=746836 RepID=A0A9N9L1T4_9HELO|nr:hypothetical protein HYFRA_00010364 [Hymenoscyphus fraxineus]